MLENLKRLSLGITLLTLSAGMLLFTDRGNRRKASDAGAGQNVLRVALVQHASVLVLEQGSNGALEGLAKRGYVDGEKIQVRRFNAEGDIGTANAIAREVTSGDFDLIISISTVSLQTVANANRNGSRTPHVFGLVTDPYAAGVGIDPDNHLSHPPYLVGTGCLQPVERIFKTAKSLRPNLKSVGLVWNAAEVNSLVQTKLARKICSELGIDLIEGNAENSTAVLEAVQSVIARGAESMWISGDVAVSTATDQVVAACSRAHIPVFTAVPPSIKNGALFDLGANYHEIGKHVGQIAADVLDGKSPSEMPVENFVPVVFLYNEKALQSLRDLWVIPDELKKTANGFISSTSTNLACCL